MRLVGVAVARDEEEFIKAADSKGLAGRLSSIPERWHPGWRWQSYLPPLATLCQAGGAPVNVLHQIRHRLKRSSELAR